MKKRVRVSFIRKMPDGSKKRVSFMRSSGPRKRKKKALGVIPATYLSEPDLAPHIPRTSYLSAVESDTQTHVSYGSSAEAAARDAIDAGTRLLDEGRCKNAFVRVQTAQEASRLAQIEARHSGSVSGSANKLAAEADGLSKRFLHACVRSASH